MTKEGVIVLLPALNFSVDSPRDDVIILSPILAKILIFLLNYIALPSISRKSTGVDK